MWHTHLYIQWFVSFAIVRLYSRVDTIHIYIYWASSLQTCHKHERLHSWWMPIYIRGIVRTISGTYTPDGAGRFINTYSIVNGVGRVLFAFGTCYLFENAHLIYVFTWPAIPSTPKIRWFCTQTSTTRARVAMVKCTGSSQKTLPHAMYTVICFHAVMFVRWRWGGRATIHQSKSVAV